MDNYITISLHFYDSQWMLISNHYEPGVDDRVLWQGKEKPDPAFIKMITDCVNFGARFSSAKSITKVDFDYNSIAKPRR